MSRLCCVFLLLGATALVATAQTTGYIDCLSGTLNVILSAPHGGDNEPIDIPNRDAGCYINGECVWSHTCGTKDTSNCAAKVSKDTRTWELAMAVRDELHTLTGKYPHVVINKLHRKKLDANRDKEEGAFNVSQAETAWDEYHTCIQDAKAAINGIGLLLDFHGYGYTGSDPWVLLGYLITKTRLNNDDIKVQYTSIKALEGRTPLKTIEDLVKGAESFGDYMESYGYPAMPSSNNTSPGTTTYYSGGYITRYYGSRYSGSIDAIQIESPTSFRANPIDNYAQAIAKATHDYIVKYY